MLFACTVLLSGCETELDTVYGRRDGLPGARSVNGTAVLAGMFQQAGHKLFTREALTPSLKKGADVIVWFPDSFTAPSSKVVTWLDGWLADDSNRTLIYVGRDYDSAPDYWQAVIPGAPAAQVVELRRRLSEAKADAAANRQPSGENHCDWFTLDYKPARRSVRRLSGPWSQGIDPTRIGIELEGRLLPEDRDDEEVLLASGKDVLAYHLNPEPAGGQLILIANGSFLLNFPLVNHEHRKLAQRLVAAVGPSRRVVFLESGPYGPAIQDEESSLAIPSGLEVFGIWPLNLVLLHLAVLGVVACLLWWPIFGRPRAPARESISDFAQHVEALGELLERTGDRGYAKARLLYYQQAQRGESAPPPAPPRVARTAVAEIAPRTVTTESPPHSPEDPSSP